MITTFGIIWASVITITLFSFSIIVWLDDTAFYRYKKAKSIVTIVLYAGIAASFSLLAWKLIGDIPVYFTSDELFNLHMFDMLNP